MRIAPLCLIAAVLAAARLPAATRQEPREPAAPETKDAPPVLEHFRLESLAREAREAGRGWTAFLERPTLRCGLYLLPAGGEDRQSPHAEDEVYHVVKGRAVLEVGGERIPVEPGTVAFVAARAPHRFVEIEEELEVLVFFSRAQAPAARPERGDR